MAYLPPVWIAKQLYGATLGPGIGWVMQRVMPRRSTVHGAKAVFHVTTHKDLGNDYHGGGLYADTAGAFTSCGKPERAQCGRVPLGQQPASARDEALSKQLWDQTAKELLAWRKPLPAGKAGRK